jgi:hypothetical protein
VLHSTPCLGELSRLHKFDSLHLRRAWSWGLAHRARRMVWRRRCRTRSTTTKCKFVSASPTLSTESVRPAHCRAARPHAVQACLFLSPGFARRRASVVAASVLALKADARDEMDSFEELLPFLQEHEIPLRPGHVLAGMRTITTKCCVKAAVKMPHVGLSRNTDAIVCR